MDSAANEALSIPSDPAFDAAKDRVLEFIKSQVKSAIASERQRMMTVTIKACAAVREKERRIAASDRAALIGVLQEIATALGLPTGPAADIVTAAKALIYEAECLRRERDELIRLAAEGDD